MSKLRNVLIAIMLLLGAGGSLYVLGNAWLGGNKEANSEAKGKPSKPQLHVWLSLKPRPTTPKATFTDANGKVISLAGFAGKPVLLNVWASWCEPCIRELPSLDRLAGQVGADGAFQVLTVNEDRSLDDAREWLAANPIANLPLVHDGKLSLVRDLYVPKYPSGLPVSVLYNAQGREVARLYGEAKWDTREMKQKILSLLEK